MIDDLTIIAKNNEGHVMLSEENIILKTKVNENENARQKEGHVQKNNLLSRKLVEEKMSPAAKM